MYIPAVPTRLNSATEFNPQETNFIATDCFDTLVVYADCPRFVEFPVFTKNEQVYRNKHIKRAHSTGNSVSTA